MIFYYCVVVTVLVTLNLTTAAEKEMLCKPNQIPCTIFECYNPETEICHEIREGRQKCKKGESMCVLGEFRRKGQCFNASTHECVANRNIILNGLWNAKICVKGEQLCKSECYNPNTETCHGDILCEKAELLCAGRCYDPNELHCSQNTLCKLTENACNWECYPSTIQKSCFRISYDQIYFGISKSDALW